MKAVIALVAWLATVAALVKAGTGSDLINEAENVALHLKSKILQSMQSAQQVRGIENCENKCDKSFNRMAYSVTVQGTRRSYEFTACVDGCMRCEEQLANSGPPDACFRYCKDKDWRSAGVLKGVIEPDKACIGGCIIQTCQVICSGGTAEPRNLANPGSFYPNGGCSIKTEPYSQNYQYVPWNSPNNGQAGSEDVARCCSNALSLCQYVGNQNSLNYENLLRVTSKLCARYVPSRSRQDICDFWNTEQNCGNLP